MNKVTLALRRNGTTFALVVILFALGAILVIQAIATRQLQQQVRDQETIIQQTREVANQTKVILASLNANAEQRTEQIDGINDHINCIFAFFTLTPAQRSATLLVPNEQTCTLQTATGPVTVPLGATSRDTPVAPAKPAAAQVQTPAPSPKVVTSHNTSAPTPTPNSIWASPAGAGIIKHIFTPVGNFLNSLLGVQ